MSEKAAREAISKLSVSNAFVFVKFYENVGNIVKGRTWTMTAWILSINAALIAFCFQLYVEHLETAGFLIIQLVVCLIGLALCLFLMLLINDQGRHLKNYWTKENKIAGWNKRIQPLVLRPNDVKEVLQPEYEAPFPKFCARLQILCGLFALGFIGTFSLMWWLTRST